MSYATLHGFFHVAPIFCEHVICLPDGRTVNMVLSDMGTFFRAVSTLSFNGDTINIVERDYYNLNFTMLDIADDQLRLVGNGILLEQLYPIEEKTMLNGRVKYSAGYGLWFNDPDAARIAKWKMDKNNDVLPPVIPAEDFGFDACVAGKGE